MNLPGVDTYVCDASATKDADARGSQICPLPDGRRKSPIGTKRAYRHSATMSALEAKPDDICSLRAFPVLTPSRPWLIQEIHALHRICGALTSKPNAKDHTMCGNSWPG